MDKTASDLLKEKLIDLKSTSTANKAFDISVFETEAKKVKDTFDKVDEHIQHRESI